MSPSKILITVLLTSIVRISFGQKCEAGMFLLYILIQTSLMHDIVTINIHRDN